MNSQSRENYDALADLSNESGVEDLKAGRRSLEADTMAMTEIRGGKYLLGEHWEIKLKTKNLEGILYIH
jgi:hypothetical protein